MTVAHRTDAVTIYGGDNRTVLAEWPAESVDCVVTSPPYFGLRSYLPDEHPLKDREIGLEATVDAYIGDLVSVFRAVRRVLKRTGSLWVNLGDGYSRDKELLGVPWRAALALQSDGWVLRRDVVWEKPNASPEPVKDRPTTSHEYLFMLTRQPRGYHFDIDAVRVPWVQRPHDIRRAAEKHPGYAGKNADGGQSKGIKGQPVGDPSKGRNIRSVWTVPTSNYRGAHFAPFPVRLIEPCIKASCPPGGLVLDPFAGTGTVGIAAAALGRRAALIDLNPEYVRMAIERLTPPPPVTGQMAAFG